MKWGNGKACVEGQPISLAGINPWDYEWTRCAVPPVTLPHPSYLHQMHSFEIYSVLIEDREVTFAATELSANVYGFYERLDLNRP